MFWLLYIMLPWTLGCMYLFKLECVSFLDIFPRVRLLDHMVALFLVFQGNSILFFIVVAPIYIPTNSARGFSFLHTLPASVVCRLFWWWPFWQVKVISHCGFDLHFSSNEWYEHIFICLSSLYMSSLEKCLFRSFVHLLIWVVWLSCTSRLYFRNISLISHMVCKYILPICWLSFHFVHGFLCCAKALMFD